MSDSKTLTPSDAKRLVVKIGSTLLVDEKTGAIRVGWMETICADIAALHNAGVDVVIVSSGAVAVGRQALGLGKKALKLEEKQAAAAIGQIGLSHAWQNAFARHNISVAQILLTPGDTEGRRQHLNARNTIESVLSLKTIPVINENDSVATEEIRFGDNDRLAARVAQMISADMVVLLSDIDGLYDADPRHNPDANFIPEVTEITPEIEAMAGEAAPGYASGGMVTKIAAADIAMRAGCRVIIADGTGDHSLSAIEGESRCTRFVPTANPATARKRWIAAAVDISGSISVDDGAMGALKKGTSLLPAGVTAIDGSFERGDTVLVKDQSGNRIGCGLIAYGSEDARLIAGHKSREIEALLGYRGRDEMIHRDDLVLDV